ncbi:MAG: methyl-accepting chemotaxis protein [Chloroflexota bacterium]|nr:methyl-accepting chemotaxis protein [Chloroflexota bacterium]
MTPPRDSVQRNVYALLLGLVGLGTLAVGLVVHWNALSGEQILYAAALSLLGVILGSVGATFSSGTYVGLEATAYYAAMMSLNPWATGLVAVWHNVRWAIVARKGVLGVLRNTGIYALMGIGGGYAYEWAAGPAAHGPITPRLLLALLVAMVVVRIINDALLWLDTVLLKGWLTAWQELIGTGRELWAVEGVAYLPAVLTTLIWSQAAIRGLGLAIWLLLLMGGALALYSLARARTQVSRQVVALRAANERMAAHAAHEAALAERLSTASVDLAGYASRLATALLQQHTAVTQVTSTVEELAQQAGYIAEAAGAVDSTAELALATAGRGQQAAAGSVQAMAALERNVHEMHSRMTTLEGRSRLIHRTLQTINSIAGETHLLALNATIEAAGAGEQGRRFSVVATQINALADQALRAAGEIQTTVREIEAATADTKSVIEKGLVETRRYTG